MTQHRKYLSFCSKSSIRGNSPNINRYGHVFQSIFDSTNKIKETKKIFLAHVTQANTSQGTNWIEHPLEEHLREVAQLASQFAQPFQGQDWAYIAGLWHDLGKYQLSFQNYIRKSSGYQEDAQNAHIETIAPLGRVDHSTAGAVYAHKQFEKKGLILAYLIAGHHAGLPNYECDSAQSELKTRLYNGKKYLELTEQTPNSPIPNDILNLSKNYISSLNSPLPGSYEGFHLWVRMLFSCLVDADFLDTERFMNPQRYERRTNKYKLKILLDHFNKYIDKLTKESFHQSNSNVYSIRQQILKSCRTKAKEEPGLFSLTVPTGGGKTLSSLAFALNHAIEYKKRRIIYAIPYTSIIEQTASIFRKVFQNLKDVVVEHHSQVEVNEKEETQKSRLACENWDLPVIVTTNVQLFESLYASKTSRCRKLHNIANSVVILDEAQMLPLEYLDTLCSTIRLLSNHYKVTFIFCTATQPHLDSRTEFSGIFNGLDGMREIVDNPDDIYEKMNRTKIEIPNDLSKKQSWHDLSCELTSHRQVLCIVNRARSDARDLWKLMPEGTYHLSALMCGKHRSKVIQTIRKKLESNEAVRVISTPLVEAGVDIDFPVVYRALSGLDSIAQAAGRCNREGKLKEGQVKVFVEENKPLRGLIQSRISKTYEILHNLERCNLLAPKLFQRYFKLLYNSVDKDSKGIYKLTNRQDIHINFRKIAEEFKIIEEKNQQTVFVIYDESDKRIGKLRKNGPDRWLMRQLQRFSVTVYSREIEKLQEEGAIENIHGYYVQAQTSLYDINLGLQLSIYDDNALIV